MSEVPSYLAAAELFLSAELFIERRRRITREVVNLLEEITSNSVHASKSFGWAIYKLRDQDWIEDAADGYLETFDGEAQYPEIEPDEVWRLLEEERIEYLVNFASILSRTSASNDEVSKNEWMARKHQVLYLQSIIMLNEVTQESLRNVDDEKNMSVQSYGSLAQKKLEYDIRYDDHLSLKDRVVLLKAVESVFGGLQYDPASHEGNQLIAYYEADLHKAVQEIT